MSPSQLIHHANRDVQSNGFWATPLKINKASHTIKKSSSSPSSSSSSSSLAAALPKRPPTPPQQRQPVIIYTHSPRVICTDASDFMKLVQKLTGIPCSTDKKNSVTEPKPCDGFSPSPPEINERSKLISVNNDDNESCSVSTEENGICCSNVGDGQVNSCFNSQPNPCNLMNNIPVFTSNTSDIFTANQPFYNYTESFLFPGVSMRTSVPSKSSTLLVEGMNEFHDY